MSESLSERKPPLHSALRTATAVAHQRLESALALLDPPLERARFLTILQAFWGFHRVWEPMLAAEQVLAPLLAGRSKLPILQRDLAAMGMTLKEIEALPLCVAAHRLGGPATRLLGGLYVLEGSTLGGQLISKTLGNVDWLPPGGLQYFNPYGPQTGTMWRDFRAALDAASAPAADVEIIAGAQDTFTLLQEWMSARLAG